MQNIKNKILILMNITFLFHKICDISKHSHKKPENIKKKYMKLK